MLGTSSLSRAIVSFSKGTLRSRPALKSTFQVLEFTKVFEDLLHTSVEIQNFTKRVT